MVDDDWAMPGDSPGEADPELERPLPPPPLVSEMLRSWSAHLRIRHPWWDATRLILVATATVAVAGMVFMATTVDGTRTTSRDPHVTSPTTVDTVPFGEPTTLGPTTSERPSVLVVDVAGAVTHPGLVRLAAGSRVADAIDAAGGPTPDADLARINRAAPITDGVRVYVPHVGETSVPSALGDSGPPSATGPESAVAAGPVNINTADASGLDALPGIGPATAQAIIDYRTQHGPFGRVEDLMDVRGIGEAKFAQLRELVTT